MQMPEAANVGVLRKKVSFKISQNFQETLVPEETPANFCKIFKNLFSTEQLGTTASESRYCNNEARDIDCICCRELDAMLIASAKIQSFYGHLPDY